MKLSAEILQAILTAEAVRQVAGGDLTTLRPAHVKQAALLARQVAQIVHGEDKSRDAIK